MTITTSRCYFRSSTCLLPFLVSLAIATLLSDGYGLQGSRPNSASASPTVIFVCEHGAAKSVVAAAWFNKLASERHLRFHAVARGFTPQADLSQSAIAGLRRDGVTFPEDKPQALNAAEASRALRIVALDPPPASAQSFHADFFAVPAPKDGYERSRDAILERVKTILSDLRQHAASK